MWDKIWTAIKHNQSLVISICICVPMVIWFWGCESQSMSLINPAIKVNKMQLETEYTSEIRRIENELANIKAQADLRLQDITRQDEIKRALYNHAVGWARGEPINPVGLLTTIGGILGIGAIIDNRRKDMLITTLKNGKSPDTTKPPGPT